jgi:hypothetical protein
MGLRNTAAAAPTMNPWLIGGSMVADTLGGLFGGSPDPAMPTNLHLVNPQQQALYNQMFAGLRGGGGDFGYGTNVKQGSSQLAQMMASRGISPQGGAAAGAYGAMVGGAASADQDARRNYMMQLLGTPLQTAQVNGANFVPGSVSAGYGPGDQSAEFDLYRGQGYVPAGVGGQAVRGGPAWANSGYRG